VKRLGSTIKIATLSSFPCFLAGFCCVEQQTATFDLWLRHSFAGKTRCDRHFDFLALDTSARSDAVVVALKSSPGSPPSGKTLTCRLERSARADITASGMFKSIW